MSNPTVDWKKVGDKFYRKIQLYTSIFDKDLELEYYIVKGCLYGGAIALFRDETKLQNFRGVQLSTSNIDIYSYAGKLICQLNWDKGSIKGIGWSDEEKLITVTSDGTVRCYDNFQGDFSQFTLGNGSDEYGVSSCRFYGSGFVALLSNNNLISVSQYKVPRPKLLTTPFDDEIYSWALIPPTYPLSRSVEVLINVGQTIYTVDASECEDRMLDIGPFIHISVSPNSKFVALYTKTGMVYVVTSDFQTRLSEYNTNSVIHPKDLQWCGNDAVVIAWEDEVQIIAPNNSAAKYFYDGRVHLISDIDGIRLITNDVCDFVQKVPEVTDEVFRFSTESPASILLDAVEQLERQSPKADDNIQLIRPNLVQAVDTCVKAAAYEFNTSWQKKLLKAASFGKSVLDIYNSDDFVDICETLRVLNAVRFYEIGLPISYEQFLRLTPEKLIKRLINRHEYLLALRIATYLRLPTDLIYVHWASEKIRIGSEDDDTIHSLIFKKLSGKRGISFTEISRAAYDEGRGRLATELLNHEPRAGEQVSLLLNMEEDEIALDKAIESGDSDLILYVLLRIKKKLPLASFCRIINNRPVATALVESSAQEDDPELLKDLYYQDDKPIEGACVFVREALKQPDNRTTSDKLAIAERMLVDSKEASFELKALHSASTLLKIQEIYEKEFSESFVGLSVNETIFKLIQLGHMNQSTKVQTEFKIPEKTAWWIRLRALVKKRDWKELEEISKTRKSPIGWLHFFNLILSAGNTKLASVFISKAAPTLQPGEIIVMYEKCGMRIKAAEEAVKAKDLESLQRLKDAAGIGSVEAREIERLETGLKRK
ncbi:putative vacuolar protein sorting-associated protein 16-like protein [Golovinomyces cichoracearum]|uniref:Probable vacuolar protein sorting-associated protein 16 homolog n=1 Tax=Golovinomyces cichoracearum TaxID=62708 RepID=A0A420H6Y4_9PEZI|nr:putative vacuolar protein sorting-associated protein 16-like protein [Golovinomyces cichoracearum]